MIVKIKKARRQLISSDLLNFAASALAMFMKRDGSPHGISVGQ